MKKKLIPKYKVGDILYSFSQLLLDGNRIILKVKIVKVVNSLSDGIYYICDEFIDGKLVATPWHNNYIESELYKKREEAVRDAIGYFKGEIDEIELQKENIEKNIKLCLGGEK